jgi:hypothetical protein
VHIHHIRHWAVYQSHDEQHMVAVCPACHDDIHHGSLPIDDETVYRWKGIERSGDKRSHLYVEPGPSPLVFLGKDLAIKADVGFTIFHMSQMNRLSFQIKESEILHLNLDIAGIDGLPLVRVIDGHVKFTARSMVDYREVKGWVSITAPVSAGVIPKWVIDQLQPREPDFREDGRITLASLRVLAPGQVEVKGVWVDGHYASVVTDTMAYVLRDNGSSPSGITGMTIDMGSNPNLGEVFGFGPYANAALRYE